VASTNEFAPTFALIDTDKDGLITLGEFKQLLDLLAGGTGVTDETAGSMFGRMDGDGDGKVTLEELTAYLATPSA
jgi:Ca2+-binding EF-hand superfamily protein